MIPVGHHRESGGGRRPGNQSTKKKILDAAIDIFAENGYDKSSLRSITSRAGVDVALVKHFFGGKEGLFGSGRDTAS